MREHPGIADRTQIRGASAKNRRMDIAFTNDSLAFIDCGGNSLNRARTYLRVQRETTYENGN
jgi:hypothetical protein